METKQEKQGSRALSIPTPTPAAVIARVTAPQAVSEARDPYVGIAAKAFPKDAREALSAPIDPLDVEIRPDGIVYLPEIKYRRVLIRAFGAGGWAMMPRSDIVMNDGTMSREYALYVDGRFVSEARGEQDYIPNNPNMSYATAAEAVKSNALMRCCKDLGIASELWDPSFIVAWKRSNAVQVWRTGSTKPQWRRKDREPFYDERGLVEARNGPRNHVNESAGSVEAEPVKSSPNAPSTSAPQQLAAQGVAKPQDVVAEVRIVSAEERTKYGKTWWAVVVERDSGEQFEATTYSKSIAQRAIVNPHALATLTYRERRGDNGRVFHNIVALELLPKAEVPEPTEEQIPF